MNIFDMIPRSFTPFDSASCGSHLYSLESTMEGTVMSKLKCLNDGTYRKIESTKLQTLEGPDGQLSGLAYHPNVGLYIALCEYSQNMVVIDANYNIAYLPYSHSDISIDGGDIYIDVERNYSYMRVSTGKDHNLSIQKTNIDFNTEFPLKSIELPVTVSEELVLSGLTTTNVKGTGLVVTRSGRFFIAGWVVPSNHDPLYNVIMEASLNGTHFNISKVIPLKPFGDYVLSGISEIFGCIGPQLVLSWSSIVDNNSMLSTMTESEFDINKNLQTKETALAYKAAADSGMSLDIGSCKYTDMQNTDEQIHGMSVGGSGEFLEDQVKVQEDVNPGFMINYGLPFMQMMSSIVTNIVDSRN